MPYPVPTPVVSLHPLTLHPLTLHSLTLGASTTLTTRDTQSRGPGLAVRVSAPAGGVDLPIIVFSHGFGLSLDSYAPLVDFWSARGFVVIQPTHLDSRALNVTPDDPRYPEIWRWRIEDLRAVLDDLDAIEAAVPGLSGRLDRSRVAAIGHSWGAQTVGTLLGARVLDANGVAGEDLADPRVKVGVLLAATGTGGSDLTPFAAENFPFMSPSFGQMTTPALVIAGDQDQSALSVRGPDWFTDPYFLSPSPKSLLTLFGAEHSLGGITGYTVTETTDESPDRVALIQRLTWAYLRSALYPEDPSWPQALAATTADGAALGRVESK
jgi:pimeloyl-ACP methyl ester carboxylesterase